MTKSSESGLAPSGRSRASARVAAGIFLSRLTGLVRERVFAHYFGASSFADAWRAALRMPNVLQNLLGEGTLSASFIPVYSQLAEDGRDEDRARFAGAVFGLLTMTAGALALLGIIAAPVVVGVFFAGFDPDRQALTVDLVRILFPMTALLVISAWALGILNSHRRFFLPYVAPVGWNVAIIVAMVAGAIGWELSGEALARVLAWGALVGGGLQLGVQLPSTLRLLGEFRPSLSLQAFGVRQAIRDFVPVVAARGAVNLGGWLDFTLAAYLATGAVAFLGYAQTLYLLPISLFGMSVAASELPELSRDQRGGAKALGPQVAYAMLRVAYFLIPSTLAYIFLGGVITSALYETGEFGSPEVMVTWAILAAYAVGMPASAASRVLSSTFYALRDTRTPARIAYVRVILSLGTGFVLMFPLDRLTVGSLRLGAAGLAMGASIAAWIEFILLRHRLRRSVGGAGMARGQLARLLLSGALGTGAGLLALQVIPEVHPWTLALGTLIPFGVVYWFSTTLFGVSQPLQDLHFGSQSGP